MLVQQRNENHDVLDLALDDPLLLFDMAHQTCHEWGIPDLPRILEEENQVLHGLCVQLLNVVADHLFHLGFEEWGVDFADPKGDRRLDQV